MKKLWIIGFLGLTLCSACQSKKSSTVSKTEGPLKVKMAKVHLQQVDQIYEYTATVKADVVNNVAPVMAGRIEKIYVEVGDRVSKGQLLVQMDPNSLTQTKTQLDNMETNFQRTDELYKIGSVSKSDWEAAKTNLEVTRTSYKNLLENTKLESPLDGIVTARNYDGGDIYTGNPIVQVQKIKPVKLLINVSETQYTKVKAGMEVEVTVDIFEGESFKGKVSLVYPTIDARSHTFPMEITIPNADAKIRPGMYARVKVNYGAKERVVVPDVAVVKQQGSGDRYVYAYEDGKIVHHKVEIGRRMGNVYELVSGIDDGAIVAITGHSRLHNGTEVEIENPEDLQ